MYIVLIAASNNYEGGNECPIIGIIIRKLNIWICFFVSRYSFNVCAWLHVQKPNTWNPTCNKMAVDKCLVLRYQLIQCRMICKKNTKLLV